MMAAHVLEPIAVACVHAAHAVQDEAAAAEYVFTAHELQLVDAAAEEYLPAPQVTHWVPPVVSLKVPMAQFVQAFAPAAE